MQAASWLQGAFVMESKQTYRKKPLRFKEEASSNALFLIIVTTIMPSMMMASASSATWSNSANYRFHTNHLLAYGISYGNLIGIDCVNA